jgi:hypothetical protein
MVNDDVSKWAEYAHADARLQVGVCRELTEEKCRVLVVDDTGLEPVLSSSAAPKQPAALTSPRCDTAARQQIG